MLYSPDFFCPNIIIYTLWISALYHDSKKNGTLAMVVEGPVTESRSVAKISNFSIKDEPSSFMVPSFSNDFFH
ncbi:MAG: hypothetical protein M3O24_01050 [Thermoproteota archaeon]|nr:hypothetical protein [Thermoproteota archaeon]